MRHAEGLDELYAPFADLYWRTGRRVGQCVHAVTDGAPSENDVLLFECPSPAIASLVVEAHNFWIESNERVRRATEAEYQRNKGATD